MNKKYLVVVGAIVLFCCTAKTENAWNRWPPRDYLIKSLAEAVPSYLEQFQADTGRFGTEPWICSDQNCIFPLTAAWSIEDPNNPWFHNDKVLEAIGKGGEALVDDMDKDGKWTFRKKDNSTWGQIHMPWTYSRWIRAYALIHDVLPASTREKWEKGLRLGFSGIRKYANGGTHNIPTHHAMALYIAGECFQNEDWKTAAKNFMKKVVEDQNSAGFWSEHFGPVVGYNKVYVDALGIYYHFSRDPIVLEALERSARFHANTLWPDGSAISCIDERQIYHDRVDVGNVGFSWTADGRGFLLKQVATYSNEAKKTINGDYAAAMLLYGGEGEGAQQAIDRDEGSVVLGENDALIRRRKPWQWAFSGYACKPSDSRWIQDRQNLIDVYHDDLGLVIGGGNTKLQPYWSTFIVGDPSLLSQKPGDENPDFTPDIPLEWTPSEALITDTTDTEMTLKYGQVECKVATAANKDGTLTLTYSAPAGQMVEAHIPLLKRAEKFQTATGKEIILGDNPFILTEQQIGDHIVFDNLKVTVPEKASLRWPEKQHNPYTKDGHSSIENAKLVLILPFDTVTEYRIVLAYKSAPSIKSD